MNNFKNARYATIEHEMLAKMTSKWTIQDSLKSRKERDWESFDKMDEYLKLKIRLQEARDYNS